MLPNARSLAFALAFIAAASVPASAQDSVAGKWLITLSSPEMGEMAIEYQFEQNGTEVTGSVDLSAIPEVEAAQIEEGLYEDKILSFLMHVSAQGQWMTVEVEADVDGDEMVGEVYMAEMGMAAPFTGKRIDN
jgi:hypothetical protein